jgi:Holliday junction resolvase RusA-like endonuclease
MGFWATMSNHQIAEIRLNGTIPSKKNSRINTSSGRSFPSREFTKWQSDAIRQVRMQTRHHFSGVIQIELIIYFGTLGRADTDNKVTSILDMLVDAIILKDDYWETVARTVYEAAYRQNKPGAFLRITELQNDFFGKDYKIAADKRDKRKSKMHTL